jgi:hypothetical protein
MSSSSGSYPLNSDNRQPNIKIYLRSPEAILYYLGEILRAEAETEYMPKVMVCDSKPPVPLFIVRKSTEKDKAYSVGVDYESTKYVIPNSDSNEGCRIDRSMHVLSLVSQLIGQQKSNEHIPVTGVVNVVGR